MCVILVAPNVDELLDVPIEKAWSANSDGAGYAYRTPDGRVCMQKGFMDLSSLIDSLIATPEHTSIVLHLRIATHGSITPQFTHPFMAGRNAVLFHNGIMPEFGKRGTDETSYSDSAHVARILRRVTLEDRKALLQNFSGTNKFVLMESADTWMFGHFQATWANAKVKASNTFWETTYSTSPKRRRAKGGHDNSSYGYAGMGYDENGGYDRDWRNRESGGTWVWSQEQKRMVKIEEEDSAPPGRILPRGSVTHLPMPPARSVDAPPHDDTGRQLEIPAISLRELGNSYGVHLRAVPETEKAALDAIEDTPTKDVTSGSAPERSPLVLHPDDDAALNGFAEARRTTGENK